MSSNARSAVDLPAPEMPVNTKMRMRASAAGTLPDSASCASCSVGSASSVAAAGSAVAGGGSSFGIGTAMEAALFGAPVECLRLPVDATRWLAYGRRHGKTANHRQSSDAAALAAAADWRRALVWQRHGVV